MGVFGGRGLVVVGGCAVFGLAFPGGFVWAVRCGLWRGWRWGGAWVVLVAWAGRVLFGGFVAVGGRYVSIFVGGGGVGSCPVSSAGRFVGLCGLAVVGALLARFVARSGGGWRGWAVVACGGGWARGGCRFRVRVGCRLVVAFFLWGVLLVVGAS